MSQHHLHEASAVLIIQHLPPQPHLAHLGQTVSSAEKQTTCDVVQLHINLSSQSHLFAEEISCLSKGRHRHSLTKLTLGHQPCITSHVPTDMLYNLLRALEATAVRPVVNPQLCAVSVKCDALFVSSHPSHRSHVEPARQPGVFALHRTEIRDLADHKVTN